MLNVKLIIINTYILYLLNAISTQPGSSFSFSFSTANLMFSSGNSLFQQSSNTTNSQNSQQQQQPTPNSGFQFGQATPSAGTTATGNSGIFKYGASTATPGTSSFNFGGGGIFKLY